MKLPENITDDAKPFFAYTQSELKTDDKVGPILDSNNVTIKGNGTATTVLNKYFASVFTSKSGDSVPQPRQILVAGRNEKL